MGTIFSRVKLSGKHVAALLALMLLSAVTAMLLPTALASMIDIGVAGENRNTILIIAAVMATLAILGCLFNMVRLPPSYRLLLLPLPRSYDLLQKHLLPEMFRLHKKRMHL